MKREKVSPVSDCYGEGKEDTYRILGFGDEHYFLGSYSMIEIV